MITSVRKRLAKALAKLAKRIQPKKRILVCAARNHTFDDPDPSNSFEAGVFCPTCKDMGLFTVGVCHPRFIDDE